MGDNKKIKISFKFHVSSFKKQFLYLVFCFVLFGIGIPLATEGALLYLAPPRAEFHSGETFIVEVRIETKECINTISVNITFPQNILEAVDFSQGNSVITLWLKPPAIDRSGGLISFAGGIPGGYCGKIKGDPGESNFLGKIIFKAREANETNEAEVIFQEDSEVLLNDGFGTKAELMKTGSVFTILPGESETPQDIWQEEIKRDVIPPEPFKIEIRQSSSAFRGRYFIVFSTIDKQTGIDYYQVKEGRKNWRDANSPYVLKNQKLTDIIEVKAVDKAGNERIAKIGPVRKITWKDWLPGIILILILIAAGVTSLIIKLRKKAL